MGANRTRFSSQFSGQRYRLQPFSPASLTELCSFWRGLKDLYTLLNKTDEVTSGARGEVPLGRLSNNRKWTFLGIGFAHILGQNVLKHSLRTADAFSVVDSLPPKKGTLRSNVADNNENVKKTIGLISTTKTSHVQHTFLYISFPFLHDYDVKMPNFTFYGGRKQATKKFYFSF